MPFDALGRTRATMMNSMSIKEMVEPTALVVGGCTVSVTEFEKNKGSFVMFIKLGIDHWNYWS